MLSASLRRFQRVRELLRSMGTKYAIVMLIVSGVAVKWLLDAYTVDKNVDTLGPAVFWNSYDSSFVPWPHGERIPPCPPPGGKNVYLLALTQPVLKKRMALRRGSSDSKDHHSKDSAFGLMNAYVEPFVGVAPYSS